MKTKLQCDLLNDCLEIVESFYSNEKRSLVLMSLTKLRENLLEVKEIGKKMNNQLEARKKQREDTKELCDNALKDNSYNKMSELVDHYEGVFGKVLNLKIIKKQFSCKL